MTFDELVGSVPGAVRFPVMRRKIRLTWVWLDPVRENFTDLSPEVRIEACFFGHDEGFPLSGCTEKVLTSWFVDDWGWFPHHPLDQEWGPR